MDWTQIVNTGIGAVVTIVGAYFAMKIQMAKTEGRLQGQIKEVRDGVSETKDTLVTNHGSTSTGNAIDRIYEVATNTQSALETHSAVMTSRIESIEARQLLTDRTMLENMTSMRSDIKVVANALSAHIEDTVPRPPKKK